ncbi:MAG: prolipoprotein diacylglyceryl transferase [Clostridia bacterium]|nr:prolipoprotein diacylglyceryl transferase [Clostridia bacterium]
MQEVTIFGIHLKLNPIAFTLPIGNGWDIYWYGIIIATGFVLALIFAYKNYKRFNLDIDRVLDVILVTTPISILCARTYYLIFDGEKLESFSDFFGFGNSGFSGLAIYGAVMGAFVCGLIMCKIRRVKVLDMFDLAALGFLIGQAIGRWGNFVNQEAFGGPTNSSWWGMTSENVRSDFLLNGYDPQALAHPCFLYESVWCIIGFFIINKFSKNRKFSGQVVLMYCVWYGFGRAIIELLRTDSLMIGRLKVSCLLSVVVCIASAVLLYVFLKKYNGDKNEGNYVPMIVTEQENKETESNEDN